MSIERKERIAQLRAELQALLDEEILERASEDLKRQCLALIRGGHSIQATILCREIMVLTTSEAVRFTNALRRQHGKLPPTSNRDHSHIADRGPEAGPSSTLD